MIPTPTSRGASSVRACSPFGRSTRWNARCVLTSNGSSTSSPARSRSSGPWFKGLQGSGSLPSALYSAHPFIWPFRAPEAEHQQHPHRYPILWPRCTSISTIDRLFNTSGEVVAEVVGRLLRRHNGSPQLPTPPASRFSFEHSISGKLDVSRHPVQLRRRQRQDRLLRRFEHHADTGRQHLPALPSCTHPQVLFANTSAHEDALHRHETYLAKEDIKYSSPRPGQVQHCLRLRSAMCMVKPRYPWYPWPRSSLSLSSLPVLALILSSRLDGSILLLL
jgi:hypothetical protein